jgi:hypothetical protein
VSRAHSRRAVVLAAGAAVTLAACDDVGLGGSPTPGRSGRSGSPGPTRDPAEVAALGAAAQQLRQLTNRYAAVAKRYPALAMRLAKPRALHDAHLARLRALGGAPSTLAAAKPVPPTATAALAELVATEQRLAVAHATAAAARSGQAARLLAMIAASQTQLAVSLGRKAAGR